MTIVFENKNVYIYKTRLNGARVYYACEKGQDFYKITYTFDLDKVSDNVMYIDKKEDSSNPFKEVVSAYKRGCLFFENQTIKTLLTEKLRKLNGKRFT